MKINIRNILISAENKRKHIISFIFNGFITFQDILKIFSLYKHNFSELGIA